MKKLTATAAILVLLGTNQAFAQQYNLVKKLENFCSAGLPAFSFTCGNPDLGYFNGHTDLNKNGIYDILEVGRTFTIDLELPRPPAGFEYHANGPATIRLDTFGDTDSFPDLPENIADISDTEHYDIEWIDVALDDYSLGRIFDGNLANDAFNMGVEQDWWGDNYDRGTLWGDGSDAPVNIYGHATIPKDAFSGIVKDGKFSTSFGLAQDHNDLTGHPSFDNREEYIQVTLSFDADLVPVAGNIDKPPVAQYTATPTTGKAPLNVAFDAGASSDTEGPITQYRWKFNDGSPLAFGKKVNHLFQLPGSYTVALSVEDNAGQTTTATRGIVASKTTPTNTAPQAAYSFTPTSGNAPLKVSFDASSSTDAEGAIKSYQWQFENGETATGKTASHTFTQAGDYPVKLTVTDGGNLTSSITHIVKATPATTTNQPPKAVMTASPASGTAPLTVQFTGTQSTDSDGQITGYTWSFGDGASTTSAAPSHNFQQAGNWKVTLTVTDNKGATGSSEKTIAVKAPASTGKKHELLPMLDVGASDNYNSSILFIEKWDHAFLKFNLGSVINEVESAKLRLFYLDNQALTSSVWAASSDQWNENSQTPVEAGQSWTGIPALASANHSSPGYIDFPVTAFIKKEASGDRIASFEVGNNRPGWSSYSAKEGSAPPLLIVTTRGSGGGTANQPPVSKFTATPTTGTVPLTVSLDASQSSDPDGSITRYEWDLGNSVTAQGLTTSQLYTQPGNYTAKLTVTDNLGAKTTSSQSITVNTAGTTLPPKAAATASPTQARINQIISFDGTGSTANGGQITAYSWSFGDGTASTVAKPTHSYATAGTYSVSLKVTNSAGKAASTTLTIKVTAEGQAAKVLKPTDDVGASGQGDANIINVGAWDHAFVKFDLSAVSGSIGTAKLRLHLSEGFTGTTQLWLAGTDAWSEQTGGPAEVGFEWLNVPVVASTSHTQAGYIEFDITALVKAEKVKDGTVSLEIGNDSLAWREYSARESQFSPELVILP